MTNPNDATPGVPVCYRHPGREAHIRCQRCERPICPDCMNSASVGFQCPECVAEGRRTQRQPRTSYGGLVPSSAGLVTLTLIGINAVVWLLINATGGNGSQLLTWLQLRPSGICWGPAPLIADGLSCPPGTEIYPGVSDGAVWMLLTTVFTHVGLIHLLFNCLSLYVLGPTLEATLGRVRFVALYLLSGLAGSTLVYWITPEYQATIGASGAVFGLMAAILVVVLRSRGEASGLLVWVAISFAYGFIAPGISWQGHLGGFLGGLAVTAVLVLAPRSRRTPVQVAGLALIAVALVVAIVLRTLQLA